MRSGLIRRLRHGAAVAAAGAVIAACGGGGSATATSPESPDGPDSAAAAEPATEPRSAPGEPPMESTPVPSEPSEASEPAAADAAAGSYRDYGPDRVADPAYDTTILFFHASWCPECRAFDESIRSGPIPDGVQILKVDYDSETDLKERYGVTLQSTFVRVDESGEQISSWVGYGKDRSIDTILAELG